MNHIYRSIWSDALSTWIAVPENTKSKGKHSAKHRKLLATSLLLCSSAAFALPTGDALVGGQATVSTPNAGQLQIDQTSQQAVINWQGFSINPNEAVNIHQPNAQAALLNRVVGQDASQIQGQLTANGQVYLVNPNGVLFGKTAQVDVGGLIASTHNIKDADFLSGNQHFTQDGATGTIENQGVIKVSEGGVVALIGSQVSNSGTIETPKGTAVLAAGKTVDLDFTGDGLVEVKVSAAALNAQITNNGAIMADGGRVVLTAKAAGQLMDTVINQEGIIRAQGLVERNGEIILDGGSSGITQVSGTLNAEGQTGGKITVTGTQVQINNGATISASGQLGGGAIVIGDKQATKLTTVQQGASVTAQTLDSGKAGIINVFANMDNGSVNIAGQLNASAPKNGAGGFIESSAAHVKVSDTARVSTLAANGQSGTWLIDPTDFTVAANGDMTGAAVSAALTGGNFTIQSTAGANGVNGDINVNDVVNWSQNIFTLNAQRNININANLNGSGTAQLALQYNQGNLGGDYFLHNGAKVTLPAGDNFSTKNCSDCGTQTYTVITSLGAQGSITALDLQGINGNLSGNYVLGADINASTTSSWNRGLGFDPIDFTGDGVSPFFGNFDGLGHSITGLTINRPTTDNIGLFGSIGFNSSIRNVGLLGGSVTGQNNVGTLVGQNDGIIINAYATGSVISNINAGGLVGFNVGHISNSYATVSVSGNSNVGGLVGVNGNSSFLGGVNGSSSFSAAISNSYATGSVTGGFHIGGLVGVNNFFSSISHTYATGLVSGNSNVGGLVGVNNGSLIGSSFWNRQTTGQSSGVGSGSAAGITGKTTAEMMQLATFSNASSNWSISNTSGSGSIWRIYDGNTAPLLSSWLVPLTVDANISEVYNGLIHNSLNNASFSIANAASSGHLFYTANPYGAAINVGSYALSGTLYSDQQGFNIDVLGGALTITPVLLNASIINNPSKVYDGTTTATLAATHYSLTGFVAGEGATVNQTIGTYNSKDVATANTVTTILTQGNYVANTGTLLSNYHLPITASGLGSTTPAPLGASIINNPSKVYDGTTTATLAATHYSLTGFVAGEGATVNQSVGTYNSKDVATANTVTATLAQSNYVANANTLLSNYQLPSTAVGSGLITPATLVYTVTPTTGLPAFFTGTVTGFVANENLQNATTGSAYFYALANSNSPAGLYPILGAGLNTQNYVFAQAPENATALTLKPALTLDNPINNIVASLFTGINIDNFGSVSDAISSPSTDADKSVTDTDKSVTDVGDQSSSNPLFSFLFQPDDKEPVIPTLNVKNSAGRVKRLQLSANKQFLSVLMEDGSVRVWDFQSGVQRQILAPDEQQTLTDISAVDDKGELISVASKKNMGAYGIIGSIIDDRFAIDESNTTHFTTSNDGSLLLMNTGDNNLSLWDNTQNKRLWQLDNKRGIVSNLALTDNKRYGAVLSRQFGVYTMTTDLKFKSLIDAVDIVDLDTGKLLKSLPNVGEQVVYMRFKDNNTLSVGLANGELIEWSLATGDKKTVASFEDDVMALDTAKDSYVYVLKNGTVRISDGHGHVQLDIKNPENPFQSAKLLEDGKKLLTVMSDGDVALWDVSSGKKMLRLFSTTQGWTVMDAIGRFDGSEEAIDDFSWLANEDNIPLDNFSENYYEPGLLSNVLQNKDYINSDVAVIKDGVSLPPKVALKLAEHQDQGDKVSVQIDVYERGAGIDKIKVYHNGKLLNDENLIIAEKNAQNNDTEHRVLTLTVTPSMGKNTLKVVASNDSGIENNSTELNFDGKTKAYASSMRLLTVGIDRYSDGQLNLDYSVADAGAIEQAIKNGANIVASKSLTNENATKPKILAELKALSQGAEQDVLAIYLAGHGIAVGKEWYFLPYETTLQPTPEKIAATGITATELSDIFKNSRIQHILLMVDSCYSGAGMGAFSTLQNGQRRFTRQLSRSLGITVITATEKNQEATELASLGHGLFTYLMTQALEKKEANQPITAHGIADSITKTLPVFSKKMIGTSQEPVTYTKGNDFILTDLVKDKQ